MIDTARKRAEGTGLPVEFRVVDAHQLDMPDNSFDASGSFATFEIIENPLQALEEMIRVTKPGGRVVVPGPDCETIVLNSSERELTRRLLAHFTDKVVNVWIGRQLPGMFSRLGMTDIAVIPTTLTLNDCPLTRQLWLQSIADNARDAGVATGEETRAWLHGLEVVSQTEGFLYAGTSFIVSGRKP